MFLNVWLMVSEAGRVGTNTGWTCSNFWICQIQKRFILWWKHKEQLSRPPGEQKSKKTPPANPRRSLFENCFKSYFDTARWWEMSCAFDFLRNSRFRCFLRRVMVSFRQQKNFGPNVIYFVLVTLLIVTRLTYSWPKHCLLLRDRHIHWPKHCLLLRDWHILGQIDLKP